MQQQHQDVKHANTWTNKEKIAYELWRFIHKDADTAQLHRTKIDCMQWQWID